MFNVSIRKATPLDAEAIASVHVHSWKKAYQQFVPETASVGRASAHSRQAKH
ncbi:hypothetical protein SC830_15965 [Legionella pneumophila serogroup 1]